MTRRLALLLFTAFILAAPLRAQGELQFAKLGDFRLESGETIRQLELGYRTFGALDAAQSNAVLLPTWFSGTTKELVPLVGPGKLVDSSKYFVILVDALGDGVSSSPSNSPLQPRMQFPRFTIRDMVRSEYDLATGVFHLSHLRAVMGISMGGMQTFQWIVSFPDFMDKAVPIVGSPQLTSYDLLLWQAELHAIEADAAWKNGNYTSIPEAGMRTVADIHTLALTTPQYRVEHTPPRDFPQLLSTSEQDTMKHFDANNWVRQLQAMMADDVAARSNGDLARAAALVRAKVLVIAATQDHMVNPTPALQFARLIHAETLELNSDCGHLSPSCDADKIDPAIDEFLAK